MAENNTVSVHCIYCGEKLTSVSEEYAYNNPNAFDILKEQESRAHKCRDEVIIRCNECGEVLGSCDPGYLEEWPNSSDIWIGQLHEQHQCLRDYTFDPD